MDSVPTKIAKDQHKDGEVGKGCTKDRKYRDFSLVDSVTINDASSWINQEIASKEPPFPVKLHAILSNPKFQDIIFWLPHGRGWRILKQKAFEEKVLPLYFRHGRYSSFARQVNGWGFRRIKSGADLNSYYHELFLRGMSHLCTKMRRLNAKDMRKRNLTESSPPPNFYEISRLHPLPENGSEDAGCEVACMDQRQTVEAMNHTESSSNVRKDVSETYDKNKPLINSALNAPSSLLSGVTAQLISALTPSSKPGDSQVCSEKETASSAANNNGGVGGALASLVDIIQSPKSDLLPKISLQIGNASGANAIQMAPHATSHSTSHAIRKVGVVPSSTHTNGIINYNVVANPFGQQSSTELHSSVVNPISLGQAPVPSQTVTVDLKTLTNIINLAASSQRTQAPNPAPSPLLQNNGVVPVTTPIGVTPTGTNGISSNFFLTGAPCSQYNTVPRVHANQIQHNTSTELINLLSSKASAEDVKTYPLIVQQSAPASVGLQGLQNMACAPAMVQNTINVSRGSILGNDNAQASKVAALHQPQIMNLLNHGLPTDSLRQQYAVSQPNLVQSSGTQYNQADSSTRQST